jgi:hypothetical protein
MLANRVRHDFRIGGSNQTSLSDMNRTKTLLPENFCQISPDMFIEK